MSIKLNKKAVFFSLIALFVVLMLTLSFRVATKADIGKNKLQAENTRIGILNNLVIDLEERQFESMVYAASKKAFLGMSEKKATDSTVDFNNNLDGAFKQIVLTGIYGGIEVSPHCGDGTKNHPLEECDDGNNDNTDGCSIHCKSGSSYCGDGNPDTGEQCDDGDNTDGNGCSSNCGKEILIGDDTKQLINSLIDELTKKYEGIGLKIDSIEILPPKDATKQMLSQTDAFHVDVNVQIKYHLTDRDGVAAWRGTIDKKVSVSIWGFTDPAKADPAKPTITDAWYDNAYCSSSGCVSSCTTKECDGNSFLNRLDSSFSNTFKICTSCKCEGCGP